MKTITRITLLICLLSLSLGATSMMVSYSYKQYTNARIREWLQMQIIEDGGTVPDGLMNDDGGEPS